MYLCTFTCTLCILWLTFERAPFLTVRVCAGSFSTFCWRASLSVTLGFMVNLSTLVLDKTGIGPGTWVWTAVCPDIFTWSIFWLMHFYNWAVKLKISCGVSQKQYDVTTSQLWRHNGSVYIWSIGGAIYTFTLDHTFKFIRKQAEIFRKRFPCSLDISKLYLVSAIVIKRNFGHMTIMTQELDNFLVNLLNSSPIYLKPDWFMKYWWI